MDQDQRNLIPNVKNYSFYGNSFHFFPAPGSNIQVHLQSAPGRQADSNLFTVGERNPLAFPQSGTSTVVSSPMRAQQSSGSFSPQGGNVVYNSPVKSSPQNVSFSSPVATHMGNQGQGPTAGSSGNNGQASEDNRFKSWIYIGPIPNIPNFGYSNTGN